MKTKKLLSTLLSAVMAVTVLASCGGSKNYSAEAAKAANAAQNTVAFETDAVLEKSLQNALKDHIQTSDVKTAMTADENLKEQLTSGYQLDVLAMRADSANEAATAIAQKIAGLATGKKGDGKIAMVLADNGFYYAAVLTYRTSSGTDTGGDESEPPDKPETPYITIEGKKVEAGTTVTVQAENGSYTVAVTEMNGSLTVTITPTPAEGYKVGSVTVDGETLTAGADDFYTTSVQNGASVSISVTFESLGYTIVDGTYVVTNENGLKAWAEKVQENPATNCTLDANITVADWTAVGQNANDKQYQGVFDGAGYTITIQNSLAATKGRTGLFGTLAGTVKNVNLDISGMTIDASTFGGIAGYTVVGSEINNCTVKLGTVKGGDDAWIGGIAGVNHGNILNCTVTGGSLSGRYVGGIAGETYQESNIQNCRISNCQITSAAYAGGIVGNTNGGDPVQGCAVQNSNITGKQYAGGIAGSGDDITACSVADCEIVYTSDLSFSIGGGGIAGSAGTVTGCAAINVTVNGGNYIGKIVGGISRPKINQCYWSDAEGNVYSGNNEGTKVDSWGAAIKEMNAAISGSGFSYSLNNGAPVLSGSAAITNKLLQAARVFGL